MLIIELVLEQTRSFIPAPWMSLMPDGLRMNLKHPCRQLVNSGSTKR
jgi:hypothetical protein